MKTIQIENKQGKVKLNEHVSKDSIDRMIEEIGRLFGASAAASGANYGEIMNAAENGVDLLEIEINSPGGSVFDGYTIFQEIKSLRERGVTVHMIITGMAASMASVIAMAGDKVSIVQHGRMMIHDASNVVGGNADQLREAADLLDGISNDIAGIYAAKTGLPIDEIRAMMKKETWMSAKETVEKGFADEVIDLRAAVSTKEAIMNLLSKIFPDKSEALDKLQAQLDENETLRNDLQTAEARIQELSGHAEIIAQKDLEISNVIAERDLLKQKADALEAEKAEFEAKVKAAEESAAAKAIEMMAQAGQQNPLALEGGSEPVDLLKQLAELSGAERTAFYNENKAAIRKLLTK